MIYTFHWLDGEVTTESFDTRKDVVLYINTAQNEGAYPLNKAFDETGRLFYGVSMESENHCSDERCDLEKELELACDGVSFLLDAWKEGELKGANAPLVPEYVSAIKSLISRVREFEEQ